MDKTDPRNKVSFGGKIGVNYSNVWDDTESEFIANPKVGMVGGLFLGLPLTKLVGVQVEALVSQKGFEGSGTLLGSNYHLKRTTTYFDIPLMLQIKPAPYITFLVGPQYSYLMSQKNTYTFGDNSIEQEQEFKNENIRKNIIGAVVGLDAYYSNFIGSVRAAWDLQNNNGDGSSSTPRYKNQWFQFTIGFKI